MVSDSGSRSGRVATMMQIVAALFVLDGLSLVLRGLVGGLFLLHEHSSLAFRIIFVLHTFVAGTVYTLFGVAVLRSHAWPRGPWGIGIALSALAWVAPALGRDTVTAFLGAAWLLVLLLRVR